MALTTLPKLTKEDPFALVTLSIYGRRGLGAITRKVTKGKTYGWGLSPEKARNSCSPQGLCLRLPPRT